MCACLCDEREGWRSERGREGGREGGRERQSSTRVIVCCIIADIPHLQLN